MVGQLMKELARKCNIDEDMTSPHAVCVATCKKPMEKLLKGMAVHEDVKNVLVLILRRETFGFFNSAAYYLLRRVAKTSLYEQNCVQVPV